MRRRRRRPWRRGRPRLARPQVAPGWPWLVWFVTHGSCALRPGPHMLCMRGTNTYSKFAGLVYARSEPLRGLWEGCQHVSACIWRLCSAYEDDFSCKTRRVSCWVAQWKRGWSGGLPRRERPVWWGQARPQLRLRCLQSARSWSLPSPRRRRGGPTRTAPTPASRLSQPSTRATARVVRWALKQSRSF